MFHNACYPTAQPNGAAALGLGVHTVVLAPAVAKAGDTPAEKTTTEGTHAEDLALWMRSKKICFVFTFPDRDVVPIDIYWQLLARQGDGAQHVSTLVFQPKDCANYCMELIRENEAKKRSSCLTVICDAMTKRGAGNVLEELEERVERLLFFLEGEQCKLDQVYFIFPEQLVASYECKIREIVNLFKDTHTQNIYCSRRTQASVPQEHGPVEDSTFTVLVLQLHQENVVDSHHNADMRARHAGGDVGGGINVDGDGGCASSAPEQSAGKTAKRKRDGQGGAYVSA